MKWRLGMYILEGHTPVRCEDHKAFEEWYTKNREERVVAQTDFENVWVSTVFLAIDHAFCEEDSPLLFETMVFNKHKGEIDFNSIDMIRSKTWEEAEAAHTTMCEQYKNMKSENAKDFIENDENEEE